VKNFLDDWLKAQESRGSMTEVKREALNFRENKKKRLRVDTSRVGKEENYKLKEKTLRPGLQKEERQEKNRLR
jgi:hypothetical protein